MLLLAGAIGLLMFLPGALWMRSVIAKHRRGVPYEPGFDVPPWHRRRVDAIRFTKT
jgi:hypothetical protein